MPKPASLTILREVTGLEPPLRDLLERLLVDLEELQTGHLARQQFAERVFEGPARGNDLARDLCLRDARWFAGRAGLVGEIHSLGQQIAHHLKYGGTP
jgi:hypothetical protein